VNRLIKAIEAIKIEVPEKSSPDYEFTVKRNQSGYIKTISAKAL
jgi:hypothetical protein